MATSPDSLKWSTQLKVAPSTHKLYGDKIILPQSALEGLLSAAPIVPLTNGHAHNITRNFDPFNPYSFDAERHARASLSDRQQQLPHPLTFRLVNPLNGRAVYAGIREFSGEEGLVGLSPQLRQSLGYEDGSSSGRSTREQTPNGSDTDIPSIKGEKLPSVTIHAKQLPKGTYVRLRPLEAGYDPEDWKSLLEKHLRNNFTTLTNGEILNVAGGQHEHFRFLVDKFEPEGEGICVVDTDLEVDIEPLNEDQARETLNRLVAKRKRAPGTPQGSSPGGELTVEKQDSGQVVRGEYVDYQIKSWNRSEDIYIQLDTTNGSESLDVLLNPFSSRQRTRPRLNDHVFADLGGRVSKRLKISHTNIDLENADSLNLAVYAWKNGGIDMEAHQSPIQYTLTIKQVDDQDTDTVMQEPLSSDEVICKNCQQKVPKRSLPLHEAFCYRNNIRCPKCSNVFLKNSEEWKSHWHCTHDEEFGSGTASHEKHDSIFHPSTTLKCPSCDFEAFNIPVLAHHRTTTCPGKEILCQFCHLTVPQQGPDDPSYTDAEVLLSGLTPHELADGARTTECHLCNKIVRLRDMKTHLKLHDRERLSRPRPRICANAICGRTIPHNTSSQIIRDQMGLCQECFGPLYVTTYDPTGKALRRRIERRLLQQLLSGCGKSFCHNTQWCKTAYKSQTGHDRTLTTKEALPLVKPVMDCLLNVDDRRPEIYFCTDEQSQSRKNIAEMMAKGEKEYELEWCLKALEESKGDVGRAREWLKDRAPRVGEVVR